ncbi:MAG: monovalent cation/H(+) antiporter subunit G [Desulfurococcaceae archaeon]
MLDLAGAVVMALRAVGSALMVLGAFASIVSAIGFHRFKNFYLRLHAATVGTIWGSVYPMFGASLVALTLEDLGTSRWFVAGAGVLTAFIVLVLGAAGSHALARGVHRARLARVQPCVDDALDRTLCG